MKDKKLYRCPACKRTIHSVGRYGRKWRCVNPDCSNIFVENPVPMMATDFVNDYQPSFHTSSYSETGSGAGVSKTCLATNVVGYVEGF